MCMCRKTIVTGLFVAGLLTVVAAVAQADVFNMPGGSTNLELVTVGNPGNAAYSYLDYSTGPIGAVPYSYQIGKYEVTNAQFAQYLNAVGTMDGSDVSSGPQGFETGSFNTDITRSGSGTSGDPYVYNVTSGAENLPVTYVHFWDTARFCNWLASGQQITTTASATNALVNNGSYTGVGTNAFSRTASSTYVVPNADEWFKAAFYDPNKSGPGLSGLLDVSDEERRHPADFRPGQRLYREQRQLWLCVPAPCQPRWALWDQDSGWRTFVNSATRTAH